MAVASDERKFCSECKSSQKVGEFYSSNNLEKHPDGRMDICKKCATMMIDNWDSRSFMWILEDCDVPWVPEEWNKLLKKHMDDKKKITGSSILGKYLAKMKLKKWKDMRFADTEKIQQIADLQVRQAMERSGYSEVEIQTAIEQGHIMIPEKPAQVTQWEKEEQDFTAGEEQPQEDYFDRDAPEVDLGLTEEDITYLRLTWGKAYRQDEWVWLNNFFEEMMEAYDIQTPSHIDTLKLACKASLKAHQLMDMGDIEGAQKMVKTYNDLMKAGNFTAAQNKADGGEFVDSIGELVALCEKDGYIERYYVDGPKDKVDFTIKDMQRYTKNLIMNENNLSTMIEEALKNNAEEDKVKSQSDEDIFDEDDLEKQLEDDDFADFLDYEEEQREEDLILQKGDVE